MKEEKIINWRDVDFVAKEMTGMELALLNLEHWRIEAVTSYKSGNTTTFRKKMALK